MGWAVGRWRMKSLLSLVYAARAVAVLVFLLAPKTGPVVLVFAAVMGLTFLSTVPPTAGLVAKFFGPANMATLFGIVMLAHQVGGFLGAWLGGKVFEATGSLRLGLVHRHRAGGGRGADPPADPRGAAAAGAQACSSVSVIRSDGGPLRLKLRDQHPSPEHENIATPRRSPGCRPSLVWLQGFGAAAFGRQGGRHSAGVPAGHRGRGDRLHPGLGHQRAHGLRVLRPAMPALRGAVDCGQAAAQPGQVRLDTRGLDEQDQRSAGRGLACRQGSRRRRWTSTKRP